MFDSIGWGEVLVIAIAALFIFGPERLPTLAKDAAAGLKRVRRAITDMREQVNDTLGDDLADLRDLDLRQYHPKTFIRNQLFADEDDPVFPPIQRGSNSGSGVLLEKSPGTAAARERDRDVPPPFDYDATQRGFYGVEHASGAMQHRRSSYDTAGVQVMLSGGPG